MKGRISLAWGEAQAVHFRILYPTSTQYTRSNWEKSLVILIWNCFYHVWTAQNDILHNSSYYLNETSALNKQVRRAYAMLQHQLDSFDTALFTKQLGERLKTSPQSKAHWLASVHIAAHDFTEVHGCLPTQLTLTSFFLRVNQSSTQSSPYLSHSTSLSCQSLSEITDLSASEYEGFITWKHDEIWNDPAGDFDPLFPSVSYPA
eukprot:2054109-Ditylum_brightwellii.AAC.1